MPEPEYQIRVTFYEHDSPFSVLYDSAEHATMYVAYAQVCRYGITVERVDYADSVDADRQLAL